MFFIADGRCEGPVTGRFRGANFPRKEGGRPVPGGHRDRRPGRDHGGVARVRPCLHAGTPPVVGSVFHLADREPYLRLNDVVCTGEVRAPRDPGQYGPDLVIDVAELIW